MANEAATFEKLDAWQLIFFGIFTPKIGEMIQFDKHIFQMGWFNHQPAIHLRYAIDMSIKYMFYYINILEDILIITQFYTAF